MTKKAAAAATRARVWRELREVARPDSRFHWDFTSFIPDFTGSEACAGRIGELPGFSALGADRRLFVTPDNSTEDFRRRMLQLHCPFVMTTYGIARGFLALE